MLVVFVIASYCGKNGSASSPDRQESHCPAGSAACLTTSKGSFSMGLPTTQLELASSDRYSHANAILSTHKDHANR